MFNLQSLLAQYNPLEIDTSEIEQNKINQQSVILPCATAPMTKAERRYTLEVVDKAGADRNSGTTCIPIRIHIVREDDGSGGISLGDVNIGMSYLNYFYLEAGIEYYICDVNYIDDSDWYDFDDSEEGALTAAHSVDDAANVFFVDDINGGSACGYAYYPGNGDYSLNILMDKDCTTGYENGTFVHEFGHFFNLQHTHDGTENGNMDSDAEHVPRSGPNSNCTTDGDMLCDTEADPNGSNDGSCNFINDGTSTQDIHGNTYAPDLDNIMSYYSDYCGGIFTTEQYTRMANGLTTRLGHSAYDLVGCAATSVTDPSGLTATLNNAYGVDLSWTDNASNETGYLIERSTDGGTTWIPVSGGGVGPGVTSYTDNSINANTTYDYRVKASNDDCNDYSGTATIAVGLVYCVPTHNSSSCTTSGIGVGIDDFELDDGGTNLISNLNNGCSGALSIYSDTHSGNVEVSQSYDYTIVTLTSGGSYFPVYHTIWIDTNQDGDFDDTGETVVQSVSDDGPTITGSFTIPASTTTGTTTMRVRVRNPSSPSDPCSYYAWSEAEDYELIVSNPLPVALTSFNGRKNEKTVKLDWSTASEDNNDYFIIERSMNGVDFEFVGQQNGQGTTNVINHYEMIDRQPKSGVNYYRLTQVDFDGTRNVEDKIIAVEFFNHSLLKVDPNPVKTGIVRLKFFTEQSGMLQIAVLDLNGRKLHFQESFAEKGENRFDLKLPQLAQGVYIVQANRENDLQTIRFVKTN